MATTRTEKIRHYLIRPCNHEYRNTEVLAPETLVRCQVCPGRPGAKVVRKLRKVTTVPEPAPRVGERVDTVCLRGGAVVRLVTTDA